MPLHGSIRLNNFVMAAYTIGRVERLELDKDVYGYNYDVVLYRSDGSLTTHNGFLEHNYSDGAGLLVAKMLQKVTEDGGFEPPPRTPGT